MCVSFLAPHLYLADKPAWVLAGRPASLSLLNSTCYQACLCPMKRRVWIGKEKDFLSNNKISEFVIQQFSQGFRDKEKTCPDPGIKKHQIPDPQHRRAASVGKWGTVPGPGRPSCSGRAQWWSWSSPRRPAGYPGYVPQPAPPPPGQLSILIISVEDPDP